MCKIKQALISVSDKTGLVEFAGELQKLGVEIISTGGTAKALEKAGIKTQQISAYTDSPELLDGRVKTLHPKVHAGLLARRDDSSHMQQLKEHGIKPIDLVVVNLYPFEKTVAKSGAVHEDIIENIDIGGVALLRAAAKNYKDVAIIVNPSEYNLIIEEMKANQNKIEEKTKLRLAKEAFGHSSKYDYAIHSYFNTLTMENNDQFPDRKGILLEKIQDLRYGENPHQKAAFYREVDSSNNIPCGIANLKQLHGKELSFNNIIDLEGAWNISCEFDMPVAVIIKHTNPCGVAVNDKVVDAYKNAVACDPVSAFGSIVGFNQEVDKEVAVEISKTFVECVIAPSFSAEALQILKEKKNIRLITVPQKSSYKELDYKKVSGGLLVQEKDEQLFTAELTSVTKRKPSENEMKALEFAWKVAKHVKSNAIIFTTEDRTIGVGAGQMSRVDSTQLAMIKAEKNNLSTKNTVLASDAFFPFRDGIDFAAKAGITAIIQPGGSIRDNEVIAACDENNIAMVFTKTRHFKH